MAETEAHISPAQPEATEPTVKMAEPSFKMAESGPVTGADEKTVVFSWKAFSMTVGAETVSLPDLEIRCGQTVLICHSDDRVLNSLALEAAGQSQLNENIYWFEKSKPPAETLEAYLNFLRRIAHVGPEGQLVGNITLFQNMCFELEYNQKAHSLEAGRLAMECLESLGLSAMADLLPEKLVGQTKYIALMALAVSRRPGFFVLERPMNFLKPLLFNRIFWVLKEKTETLGQAVLVLERSALAFPEDEFNQVIHLEELPI
jgi:ABC-type arginine transport system ATPase subunit